MPADQPAAVSSASREDAERYALERTDVLRLRSLLPLCRVEFDLLVLIQRPVARTRDRGEVDEHVRRPVIWGDETEALVGVEPLHCSCCHQFKSSNLLSRRLAVTTSLLVFGSRTEPYTSYWSSVAHYRLAAQH